MRLSAKHTKHMPASTAPSTLRPWGRRVSSSSEGKLAGDGFETDNIDANFSDRKRVSVHVFVGLRTTDRQRRPET